MIPVILKALLALHLMLPSALPQGFDYSGSPGAGGAFAIVASCTSPARNASSAGQFACTSNLNIPSGDMLVLTASVGCATTGCITSACDTATIGCSGATNTLALAINGVNGSWGGGESEVWYLCNTTANATATFYINMMTNYTFTEFALRVVSGAKTSGCLDATSSNTTGASTSSLTVPSITTTQAGEFVLETYSLYNSAACTDSTYTILNPGSTTNLCDGYYVPTGTLSGATATASTGVTSQNFFSGLVATFEHL